MKLVVDDDPLQMRKRFVFLVDHEELMEYAFGINPKGFEGGDGIASALLFLFRIYVAAKERIEDADLRVQMHEMQSRFPAGAKRLQDGQTSGLPEMLPPGEEDIIDAEFSEECGDEAAEET